MIFKIVALVILFVSVYLLYCIAFPKQPETKKEIDTPQKKETDLSGVVMKRRFVRPDFSQPQATHTMLAKDDILEKNPYMFAAETEKTGLGVISTGKLDELFEEEPNPEDLEIDSDDDASAPLSTGEIDLEAEEESEQSNRVHSAMLAEGLEYDDLHEVAKVIKLQPETVSVKTAATMAALEHTDMFELLVSVDESKANWIKSVIDRHVQTVESETDNSTKTENETSDSEYYNFDVADFLGKSKIFRK